MIVNGMEMPKDCRECLLCNYHISAGETWCEAIDGLLATDYGPILFDGRDSDCPLVEIKTPHGRLIDADALIADIKECIEAKDSNCEWEQVQGLEVALSCAMDDAPTVIEAEEDQEG